MEFIISIKSPCLLPPPPPKPDPSTQHIQRIMWSGASLRRWNCAEADNFRCTCRHGSWTQAWVQNIWAEGWQKLLWWTLTILLGRVRSLSYVNLQLEERERVIRDEKQTRNIREAERSRTIAVAPDFSEQPFIEAQRCKQGRWGHCTDRGRMIHTEMIWKIFGLHAQL